MTWSNSRAFILVAAGMVANNGAAQGPGEKKLEDSGGGSFKCELEKQGCAQNIGKGGDRDSAGDIERHKPHQPFTKRSCMRCGHC